jgi:hypothetical protein
MVVFLGHMIHVLLAMIKFQTEKKDATCIWTDGACLGVEFEPSQASLARLAKARSTSELARLSMFNNEVEK